MHVPNEGLHFDYLFKLSKNICRWTTIIDPDEFLFPLVDTDTIKFLPPLLVHQEKPLRMPWFLMSSHGYENKTGGLLINRFTQGVMNNHIKSLVKSSWVSSWKKSHFPFFKNESWRYAQEPFANEWEMNMDVSCPIPKNSSIYVRHFLAMSWEEYMRFRGSRNLTSDNENNPWLDDLYCILFHTHLLSLSVFLIYFEHILRADDPRKKWLSFNLTSSCLPSPVKFSKKITTYLLSNYPILKKE